jgi:DNA-binding XRE family transcriptional regulator
MSVTAIAARLTRLREAMEWSQTTMAERVGVQLTTWNNYETAVSPIPWRTALNVCVVTGASLDWIYRDQRGLMPVALMDKIEAPSSQSSTV